MRVAVIIEKAEGSVPACVPDLPGCVTMGASLEAVESSLRAAIALPVEGDAPGRLAGPPVRHRGRVLRTGRLN